MNRRCQLSHDSVAREQPERMAQPPRGPGPGMPTFKPAFGAANRCRSGSYRGWQLSLSVRRNGV